MHPLILALGLKMPLTKFIRSILTHYRVTPSQLSGVAWRIVHGFEALCALSVPEACQCDFFSTTYTLRKTSRDARYFMS